MTAYKKKRDGSEFAKECVRVNGIVFNELADYLRHGREIEFAVNGRAYSITNHSGKWHLCDDIIMKTQYGMVETTAPYRQLDGFVEFHDVRWDFRYVYLLGVTGNIGTFTGEKLFFKDFLERYRQFGFSLMDESYGYNMTKYTGYLLSNRQHCECIIEIYHEGDMVFVSEE